MKILVVYHSIYGHVEALAKAVGEGVQEVAGVELVLRRVREFPEVVQHMEKEKGFSYFLLFDERNIFRQADGHGQILCQDRPRRVGLNPALIEKLGHTGLKIPG